MQRLVVAVILVVGLAAACAGAPATTTGAPAGSIAATKDTSPLGTAPPPEQFAGSLDDFYRVPQPLPAGAPGELIRVQAGAPADGSVPVRVMYHSRDALDRDRAVTGTITYPTTTAPVAGWPVIAWAHGTTGLASACAPSRLGDTGPDLGVLSVRVATDYIGLGPVGERHAYLSGPSEAHSVIDGVRAARLLADAHASTTWVAVGHSQGGHAALWTNQLGRTYAPELDLRGTVAIAPAAVLDRTFGPDDQLVPRMVGVMALYGIATDHPEVHPDDYVGDEVRAKAGVIDQSCLALVVAAMAPIPADAFYAASPIDTEPARSAILANDPGHVAVASPLLVVYGTKDIFVVPERVHALYDQLCGIGQSTDLIRVDGADHTSVVGLSAGLVGGWLNVHLNGQTIPDDCGKAFG